MVSDAGKADWQTPDHPASLFEGLAGGICLLAELQAAAAAAAAVGDQQEAAAALAPTEEQQQQQQQQQGWAGAAALHRAVCGLVTFPLFDVPS
jgi:hypothetical protein